MGYFLLALPGLSFLPSLFFFIVAAKLAYDLLKRNVKSLSYPPGPKPKFLIGNALDFPKGDAGRVFAEWGKRYNSTLLPSIIARDSPLTLIISGDILHAGAFGNHVVVINSFKIAEEIFERRAKLYNDRPVIPIVEVCVFLVYYTCPYIDLIWSLGWEYNIGLLRYGDVWRKHRKMCWQNFHDNAARKYRPTQRDRIHLFLRSVLQEPERVFEHHTL